MVLFTKSRSAIDHGSRRWIRDNQLSRWLSSVEGTLSKRCHDRTTDIILITLRRTCDFSWRKIACRTRARGLSAFFVVPAMETRPQTVKRSSTALKRIRIYRTFMAAWSTQKFRSSTFSIHENWQKVPTDFVRFYINDWCFDRRPSELTA